uniref:Prospero domain-containing protein n=1 Tax=Panagrolaimus sp. JU765 TaxID=591449 RepID=A0AC34RJ97_9BILA
MSSGGLAPQQPPVINPLPLFSELPVNPNPVSAFNGIFNNNFNFQQIFAAVSNSQRAKLKRCRQRVDAGEPRNTYQNQPKMNDFKRERSISAPSENGFNVKIGDYDSDSEDIPAKRMKTDDLLDDENSFAEADQKEIDDMLEQDDQQNDGEEGDELCHSNNSAMSNSSSRRKCFQPQRQMTGNNDLAEDPEFANEKVVDADETSVVGENGSRSPDLDDENDEVVQNSTPSNHPNYLLNMMNMLPPNLNNFNNSGTSKLQELLEVQRRIQMNNSEPNQKEQGPAEKLPSLSHLHQTQSQEVNQGLLRLMQSLKDEIGTVIEKVVADYRTREARAFMERMLKTVAFTTEMQQQMQDMKNQQQQRIAAAAASFLMPKSMNSMYNPPVSNVPTFSNPAMSNFLAAAAAANQNNSNTGCSNSIFPAPQTLANFSAIGNHLNNNPLLRPGNNLMDNSLKKKRSKVTDSLRVNKTGIVRDSSNSLPASERSSPLSNNYFPPTMVSHPLYNNTSFNQTDDIKEESAENSDSFSDCGPYDGNFSQNSRFSSTLTPIHLRKAKLMFFYTRYPSSALLKSYFPDIRFNKNNTAQLVKWFSNFREFFYMQMEKYAKQALAEGVEHRSQIVVTEDSEIYKTLNQHYNRNNLFPPPPRLRIVIEETLREFFTALQQGRDAEPSWKKAIYKIINQMDDPIPEHFKHPSFMNSLE